MEQYKKEPITLQELNDWNSNKLINPRNNMPIDNDIELFEYIESEYNKQFPQLTIKKEIKQNKNILKITSLKVEDSIDDKDPVSLTTFWVMKNDKKKVVYKNASNLILYKDSMNLIRCFERETLSYFKTHKIFKHPVSGEPIPNEIFDQIEEIKIDQEKTVKQIALDVFQKFGNMSIFIDSDLILELSKEKIIKFNYELREFYHSNIPEEIRNELFPEPILTKLSYELEPMNIKEIHLYTLNNMDKLLDVSKEEVKYMINYILVGALGIVIPQIRELYPDLCYDFMV